MRTRSSGGRSITRMSVVPINFWRRSKERRELCIQTHHLWMTNLQRVWLTIDLNWIDLWTDPDNLEHKSSHRSSYLRSLTLSTASRTHNKNWTNPSLLIWTNKHTQILSFHIMRYIKSLINWLHPQIIIWRWRKIRRMSCWAIISRRKRKWFDISIFTKIVVIVGVEGTHIPVILQHLSTFQWVISMFSG